MLVELEVLTAECRPGHCNTNSTPCLSRVRCVPLVGSFTRLKIPYGYSSLTPLCPYIVEVGQPEARHDDSQKGFQNGATAQLGPQRMQHHFMSLNSLHDATCCLAHTGKLRAPVNQLVPENTARTLIGLLAYV
jgi:hypothetical protein